MEELKPYKKGADSGADKDFSNKTRFGMVYYRGDHFFTKKGLKWSCYSLNDIARIELIRGSRQLRQCCGAPIYEEKLLLITTKDDEHLYLTVEEVENGDLKHSERLLSRIRQEHENINVIE